MWAQTLNGLVNILSLEDYDAEEEKDEATFFTRAKIKIIGTKKKKYVYIPAINEWKYICECKTP